jgi:PIN domain nuclease of toxin-antitoxin system
LSKTSGGLLLDTHTIIWLAGRGLSEQTLRAIERAEDDGGNFVSPITAWEIGLLARANARTQEAVQFLPDARVWLTDLMARFRLAAAPLTCEMAVSASFLPGSLHRDPADRLLIATARELDLVLLTADSAILDYAAQGHVRAIAC